MNAKTNKRTMTCYLRRMDLAIANWRLEGERTGDKELAKRYAADVEDLTAFREAFAAGDFGIEDKLCTRPEFGIG